MFAEKKTFFPPLYQPLLAAAPRSGANIVSERLIATLLLLFISLNIITILIAFKEKTTRLPWLLASFWK